MHPFTFRPLTLGVLIVVGGTLAALPFRRYRPAGELASASADSTGGPVGSSLTSAPLQDALPGRPFEPEPPRGQDHPSEQHARSVQRLRPMHAPLTYEDLAVPIDRSPVADQRPTAVPKQELASRAGAAPQDFRPKAMLPPKTDLQPLTLSEAPPPTAGLAGTGDGPRSVLVPTPAKPSTPEAPAPERPQAAEANRPSDSGSPSRSGPPSQRAEPSPGETDRLAENSVPGRSASNRPDDQQEDVQDRDGRADDASHSRRGSPEGNSGTLASSKLSGGQPLSVTEEPPSRDPRKRYWIRQPR